MAWLPTFLLKTHRCLLTCATTMCLRFIHERRRNAALVKIRHSLATLNSNNSVVYGQKHKVWVLVFLFRTSRTFRDQNLADLVKLSVLQQNCIVFSNSMQETLLSISSNGLGNKTVISCLFVCLFVLLLYVPSRQLWSWWDGQFTLPHFFSWASLNKQLTSTSCTYFCLLLTTTLLE